MTAELVPAEVVAYHGLKPGDRMAELMILLGERYRLDPLVGHLEVIKTRSGPKLYITRDGYIELAHRSQMLDGIVVEDLHHGHSGWSATVSVWRKDCRFPFTYSAGCGDKEPQAVQGDGDSMALARAERRALKRAFPVIAAIENEHGLGGADVARDSATPISVEPRVELEIRDDVSDETRSAIRAQLDAETGLATREWVPSLEDQAAAHKAGGMLGDGDLAVFLRKHGIRSFENEWPATAVAEILADVDPPETS